MRGAGLCGECVNARVIETRTGSRFLLCELSRVDDSYARYPRLPVLRCRGFRATGSEPPSSLAFPRDHD